MNKEVILTYIQMVAGKYPVISILLHILILALIIALFLPGFKQKRIAFNGVLMVIFASVASVALINGNPFNGLFFSILTIFAVVELFRRRNEITVPALTSVDRSTAIRNLLCLAAVFVGILYPHFVNVSPAMLLFFSPMGVIPCPTLTVILGLLNLYYPKINKGLYTVVTIAGMFYGLTGVFLLHVYIDIPLMILALYSLYRLVRLGSKKWHPVIN